MASSDHPSTLDVLNLPLPFSASSLIFWHQISWGIGYISLIAAILHKQRYVGLPFTAVILNFGWEFCFGMIFVDQFGWEAHGHRFFMLMNITVIYQFLQTEVSASDKSKILYYTLLSASIWLLLIAFVVELNDYGGIYSFFVIRFVTSLLTARQLFLETRICNISEVILPGICRLLSSGFANLALLKILDHSVLLSSFGLGCLIWDILYVSVSLLRYNSSDSSKEKGE
jgi:hypothetical protein